MTDDDERLLIELCAQAIIADDPTLKIAAAKFMDFGAPVSLRVAYAIAERVRAAYTLDLDAIITTNGSHHE